MLSSVCAINVLVTSACLSLGPYTAVGSQLLLMRMATALARMSLTLLVRASKMPGCSLEGCVCFSTMLPDTQVPTGRVANAPRAPSPRPHAGRVRGDGSTRGA